MLTERKPLIDHVLPKEELGKETTRLIDDIKEALRRSPEFQQASANSFLDESSIQVPTPTIMHPEAGGRIFNAPVSFQKDGNRHTISRIPNLVKRFGEEVELRRQNKEGTIITVLVCSAFEHHIYEILDLWTNGDEISFSQTLPGLKEEKIKNTRMTVEKIDQFIRELNSPTPATS